MKIRIPIAISDDGRWCSETASWRKDASAAEAARAWLQDALDADPCASSKHVRVEWVTVRIGRTTSWWKRLLRRVGRT